MNDTLLCQTSNVAPFLNFKWRHQKAGGGQSVAPFFFFMEVCLSKSDMGVSFFSCRLSP